MTAATSVPHSWNPSLREGIGSFLSLVSTKGIPLWQIGATVPGPVAGDGEATGASATRAVDFLGGSLGPIRPLPLEIPSWGLPLSCALLLSEGKEVDRAVLK